VVWSSLRIGLTLIGGPAPEALSALLAETAADYFSAEAGVRLVRSDVVDAGVVKLVVIPVKVSFEVGHGLAIVQKLAGIFRGALDGGKGRLDDRIVVGGSRVGEQLRHVVILAELADRRGFHLATAVIEQFGPLVFRQVQDVSPLQTAFEEQPGLRNGLRPTNPPMQRLAGILIGQQVEVKIHSLFQRQQVLAATPICESMLPDPIAASWLRR